MHADRHPHHGAAGAIILGAALGYASIKFKVEGDPLVEKIDAILPQTQCGQCGYPGCKPYAEAIAKAKPTSTCARPAARKACASWPTCSGAKFKPLDADRKTQAGRDHRRADLHRLHAVHPGLPGRCHRRRRQADAHHRRVAVHRLRAVHVKPCPVECITHGSRLPKHRQLEVEVPGHRDQAGGMMSQELTPQRRKNEHQGFTPRLRGSLLLCAFAVGFQSCNSSNSRAASSQKPTRPLLGPGADRTHRCRSRLVVPLHQSIGGQPTPLVEAGERVLKGQRSAPPTNGSRRPCMHRPPAPCSPSRNASPRTRRACPRYRSSSSPMAG
jgi:hypothetical protein